MFKILTSRKNFLLTETLVVFLAVTAFSKVAHSEISRCEGMFAASDVGSALEAPVADSFWLRVSKVPTSEAFEEGVVSQLGKSASDQAIYRRLIAPAIWNYARLAIEHGTTSDPMTEMVNRISDQLRIESRPNPRRDDHIRPKAMTASEREDAIAVGHFGLIEGSRLPAIKSAAQKRREALEALISQAQRAYSDGAKPNAVSDPVRDTFMRLKRRHVDDPMIAKSEIDSLLADPVDFAIVYAQQQGLTARAGVQGDLLSPLVPWMRPAQNLEKFRTLSDMVALARALNQSSEAMRAADVLVLETLRRAFAPHLTEFLP